jgi:DNA-directed RNA polymerase specialized sigma24 family protein
MTRNAIIESIYNDKKYINYCKQVLPNGDLYNDLFQYVCEYLLKIEEKKLIDLHKKNQLRMYVARIIYINAHSERSEFNKQYNERIDLESYLHEVDLIDFDNSDLIDFVKVEIENEINYCNENNIYPASIKLLEIYADLGSYKEVSVKTKIPYLTVINRISKIREKIKKNINDKNTFSNSI